MNSQCIRVALWSALVSAALSAQPGPPPGGPGGAQGDAVWLRNAYYGESHTFDACVGHQPGNGQYHYHASPMCLRAQLGDNVEVSRSGRNGAFYREKAAPWTHSPILGWAYDGYPIYGPYGWADPKNPASPVKRLKASFRLRAITQRTTLPEWVLPVTSGATSTTLTAAQYGPAVSATFPLGRYLGDYEFVKDLGDLDVHNGRFAVTPEYPQGTYAYITTLDDDGNFAFPYIYGAQFYGSTSNGGTARTVATGASDFFNNGSVAAGTSSDPLLASWMTKSASQAARVYSNFNPSAGAATTWPNDVPTGANTSGSVTTPVLADVQRIRQTESLVYVNVHGLASHTMGPWFDPGQQGGIFGAYPTNQNLTVQLPKAPAVAATKTTVGLGAQGVWVNGVAVFNFLDGASYSNARGTDAGGGIVGISASHVSAASFEPGPIPASSIVTAFPLFGLKYAVTSAVAPEGTWPTQLGGAAITVKDSAGTERAAQIYAVSPTQISYLLPAGTAVGYGSVSIAAGGATFTGNINVRDSYPNLFALNTDGLAAAYLTRVRAGQSTNEQVFQQSPSGALLAAPIDLGPASDLVYLVLYGSGIGTAGAATASIGGVAAEVSYAGRLPNGNGLDQYNVLIPRSLVGKGKVDVVVTAGNRVSNTVNITIR
ncbi:MAG: YHYH protein [Acidobacteria bacterium]|nr:YHYH protein [Acidobacteriota bacterium]